MKDYLNSNEVTDFVVSNGLLVLVGKILKEWGKRGNLTKEEIKYLKYVKTYMTKFFFGLLGRINEKEKAKINRRLEINSIEIVDKFTLERNKKLAEAEFQKVILTRDEFESICCEIMAVLCERCDKDRYKCEVFPIFDKNKAPEPSGYTNDNCKYSYGGE